METNFVVKKPEEGQPWDVAIVGGGPAALTAAIYTTRGNASTIIFAGDAWGGQLMLTTTVDNFPGFPEGIEGPELMTKMRAQAERFGAELLTEQVERLLLDKQPFTLHSGDKTIQAKTIIFATGAETKWLGIPGEDRLRGRGVSSCAPCDAPFFKDKVAAVVGGGDSAMEEALVIAKYAREVILVHRKNEFRASAAMQDRVKNTKNIRFEMNTQVLELVGDTKLEKAKVTTTDKGERELSLDGLFVAIGHSPSTALVHDAITLDEIGFIKRTPTDHTQMSTNIPGVFVAGDVHDRHYKQAITAAGFGAMAALETLSFLDKSGPSW